jgi:DNA invertase Pin-like site-specific DNA recombinase
MLQYARSGDIVVCYSIDRMARDLRDLQDIVTHLNDKGVVVCFLAEGLFFSNDNDDAMSKLMLQMMGSFAQFERSMIHKRQAEGIALAKGQGREQPVQRADGLY